MSIYNYLVKKPNGEILSMETYRNEVMLIVNTASHCELTYQYEDLQKLYERYAAKENIRSIRPIRVQKRIRVIREIRVL